MCVAEQNTSLAAIHQEVATMDTEQNQTQMRYLTHRMNVTKQLAVGCHSCFDRLLVVCTFQSETVTRVGSAAGPNANQNEQAQNRCVSVFGSEVNARFLSVLMNEIGEVDGPHDWAQDCRER